MEKQETSPVELLKLILSNLRDPKALNAHPWTLGMTASAHNGERLIKIVASAFRKMTPQNPPRAGKRLDTQWGAFGVLAAQYFAPLALGEPFPNSLRNAWENMDRSILFFVYGDTRHVSELERAPYRFAGNEIEPAPNSTLSDWHRKGLENLAEMTQVELKKIIAEPKPQPTWRKILKSASLTLGGTLLLLVLFLGWKGWNLYQRAQAVQQKVDALEAYLSPNLKMEQIPEIAVKTHDLRVELDALQLEAEPFFWTAPYFAWVPDYGGTITQSKDVLTLAQRLATAADEGLTAITPAVKTTLDNHKPLEVMDVILQLQTASPQLLNAQVALAQAQDARSKINADVLIPRINNIIVHRIDPLFTSIAGAFPMEDALTIAHVAPILLGGGKTGPQTYLILMQNEDELRPTGGFLTAVGTAVVKDGKLLNIKIETSEKVDDFSKPYPIPPWQFEKFMNIQMLLFRDSNWFTDFPTTASWAEYFYSYSRASSADGIIALDMRVVEQLLKTLGAARVDSVNLPITSENVQEYLRSAEKAPPKNINRSEWDRKEFIGQLAKPLLEKLLTARGETWTKLTPVMLNLLDEKHILLQFDNEEMTALLQRRNWDGATRIPQNSDFLMTVDANMGYNKSNAVMASMFEYNVNLVDSAAPVGSLTARQINESKADVPCEPFASSKYLLPPRYPNEIRDPYYNMDECHFSYLRIYTPSGTKLLRSNPKAIPAESTMLGETIPARTDNLGSEDILNAQVFGMFVITPTHSTTDSQFEYSLPAEVVTKNSDNTWTYRLKVQKQPGIIAQPFTLTLRLPFGMKIKNAAVSFTENDGAWTALLDLRRDLLIEATFGN